jgi:glycosyltransferase involved in cell wall biosynthesis
MKKILLVGPFPPAVGGVTTSLHNILYSDLSKQYQYTCFSNSRPPKRSSLGSHGYKDFFQGGLARMISGIFITLHHILIFPLRLRTLHPDIVQIHTSDYFVFWENTFYLLWAKLLGKRVILRMGGVFDKFYRNSNPLARLLIRRILRLPDVLIVQSDYWKSFILSLTKPRRIRVVNNFLDISQFPSPAAKNPDTRKVLFICGTESLRKGLDVVLESIRYLSHDGIGNSKFIFVASNEQIRKRVRELQVHPYVEFRDILSKQEMIREYGEANLFVLPSFGEGFPNSLLEAMASGLPVVATRVGAVPEVVEHNINGILIEPGDPGALTRAIKKILNDPELGETLGRNNLEKVKKYSARRGVDELDSIYRELLQPPPFPADPAS